MDVLQTTVGNKTYPPDTGGYQRTHGLTVSFPTLGDSVTRYCCTGPLATYYREGELLETEVEVTPGIVEKRRYRLLHDVPKAIAKLGYPGFAWSGVFKTWAGESLLSAARNHDVAVADNPYLALFLAENAAVPTVYSSHNIEYRKYRSTADGWGAEFFGRQLRGVEAQAVETSDLVVCTTESDRTEFERYTEAITVIPNGISAQKFTHETEPADRSEFGIPADAVVATFLGSDYEPNNEAATWLASNWSALDDDYHLLVIGDAGQHVDDSETNVHTAGYVEELSGALAMADVALNPIFTGGGSNVKLIEYFAAELPVVSTPFGARGFAVKDGEHLVLAEQDTFLDKVGELGRERERRERLAANGHELAATRYTWESLSDSFREEIHRLVG